MQMEAALMSSKLLNITLFLSLAMLGIVLVSPWQTLARIGSYVAKMVGYN